MSVLLGILRHITEWIRFGLSVVCTIKFWEELLGVLNIAEPGAIAATYIVADINRRYSQLYGVEPIARNSAKELLIETSMNWLSQAAMDAFISLIQAFRPTVCRHMIAHPGRHWHATLFFTVLT